MKKKDKEIILKSDAKELTKAISETRKTLEELVVNQRIKPVKNSRVMRLLKKKLALLLTIFRQKELVK